MTKDADDEMVVMPLDAEDEAQLVADGLVYVGTEVPGHGEMRVWLRPVEMKSLQGRAADEAMTEGEVLALMVPEFQRGQA